MPSKWVRVYILFACALRLVIFEAQGAWAKSDDLEENGHSDDIFIWHSSTLHAANGKLAYYFEAMAFETREFKNIVLQTNAGEAHINSLGGMGYNRNENFSITSESLDRLLITAARDDGEKDILDHLNTDIGMIMDSSFKVGPHPFEISRNKQHPSPLLKGKTIHISLAPTIPAMQSTGVYLFSLEYAAGLGEITDLRLHVTGPEGQDSDLDILKSGMTAGGTRYALARYEAFLLEEASPKLTVPKIIVIDKAEGRLAGQKVNILPSLQPEIFKPIPIQIGKQAVPAPE